MGQAQRNGQRRKTELLYEDWGIGKAGYSRGDNGGRRNHTIDRERRIYASGRDRGNYASGRDRRSYAAVSRDGRNRRSDRNMIDYGGAETRPVYRNAYGRRRRRVRKRKAFLGGITEVLLIALSLFLIYFFIGGICKWVNRGDYNIFFNDGKDTIENVWNGLTDKGITPPEITEDYLEINEYSRPGTELKQVKSIFVHYTANKGTSAAQNRSYFSNLPLTKERSASAHLIIGYDGEIVQCIPFDEQAFAVITRNDDSISIECCYLSDDGSFTQETYDTLVHTLAWLIDKYDLTVDDILRHYDCGGKLCPLYYVEHEDAWDQLLRDVSAYEDADQPG